MAQPPTDAQDNIERQIAEIDGGTADPNMMPVAPTPERLYKQDPQSKIMVSKHEGKVWEAKIKSGRKIIENLKESWEEAERYYSNSQESHRKLTGGDKAGNAGFAKDRRESFSTTENYVYSTVNAVIPAIYAKNPDCEITMFDPARQKFGDMMETLVDRLASMRSAPGFNLKPKIRKSIVRTEISNESWVLVGYTQKQYSADQARKDIYDLGQQLLNAKDGKEIEELEGKLLALEEQVDLLDPAGPFVKSVRGVDVTVDPDSQEDDFSDANWMSVSLMFSTAYLNAKYREKDKDGKIVSAYEPTHVVDVQYGNEGANTQEEIDSFKMVKDASTKAADYGYESEKAFDRAKRTKCELVFDKVKRRWYLYSHKDWKWPIWVLDDPYQLPNFYPLHRLQYHTDPKLNRTKGEVSFYLDQQDGINTIADEMNRARKFVRDKIIFNSAKFDAKQVEDLMLNPNKKAVGVDLGEEGMADINKHIGVPDLPTLKFQALWDSSPLVRAINQISGVGDAMRGEQFKTNTTNKAIEEYSSLSSVRLDEKRDAVEDFVGNIMYDIAFMCLRFMDQETVADIVGQEYADVVSQWSNMEAREVRRLMACTCAGGSSQKPTSAAKKAEALQVGQILGLFTSATPMAIIVALELFERSFDGVNITRQMWEEIKNSIMMQLQRGNSQGGPAQPGGDPAEGAESPEQEGLSPEQADHAVKLAVARGMPEEQAKAEIAKRVKH